jgi:hypothetical protein
MAKAKFDFKKLMLEKGERIGIIAGGILMVLLIAFGLKQAFSGASKVEIAKKLNSTTKDLNNKIKNGTGDPPPLADFLFSDISNEREDPVAHRTEFEYFLPSTLAETKRGSPKILSPDEFQIDLYRGQALVYNIIGEKDRMKIAVVASRQIDKNQANEAVRGVKRRRTTQQGGAMGPGGMGPGGPGGMGPGGPGGMMGPGGPGGMGPGGPGGMGPGGPGGRMGGPGGPGGDGGAGMGGLGGMGAANSGPRTELGIEYIELSKLEGGQGGKVAAPAKFIQPVRMAIVTASFPYKKQMEEYAKALRYKNVSELLGVQADMPSFKGFNVERRVKSLDGSKILADWAPLDWVGNYRPLMSIKVDEDEPEDEMFRGTAVIPDPDQNLFMPLPKLARGTYPRISLRNAENAIDVIRRSGNQVRGKPFGGRFEGEGNPFARGGASTRTGMGDGNRDNDKDRNDGASAEKGVFLEALLVRFIDVAVQPGFSYEYRMQMKLANPNKGKHDQVSRPDYSKADELVGDWVEVVARDADGKIARTGVSVQPETQFYAMVPDRNVYIRPDHVRLHVQSWLSDVRLRPTDNRPEPFGEWVTEEIDVPRGQYITDKKTVKLPLWSPTQDNFFIGEPPKSGSGTTRPAPSSKQPGVTIEFGTRSLLVDFEGGRVSQRVKDKTVTDDAGMEVLVMSPNGRLELRVSTADDNDPLRNQVAKRWEEWVEEVKNNQAPATKPGENNPFGSNRPGGS